MTRVQAEEHLRSLGIEAPTDEQISAYLNQIGSETKKEKENSSHLMEKNIREIIKMM